MDKTQASNNLLSFKTVLDSLQIEFGLIFGTLLGAVRDNDFIPYDDDIDVYINEHHRQKLLNNIEALEKVGFSVMRYNRDLISFSRQGVYIDVYIFRKPTFGPMKCNEYRIPRRYLATFGKLNFLDTEFLIPNLHLGFLEHAYGNNWRIPKINSPANTVSLFFSIMMKVKPIIGEKTWSRMLKLQAKLLRKERIFFDAT